MADPQFVSLLAATLAVWRLTHLLWDEDGPGDVFVRLRRLAGRGFFGRLIDCFYCSSLWVAAPFAWLLGATWAERLVLWLALSGGAILLERVSAPRPAPMAQAEWHEELAPGERRETRNDVLLR